MFDDGLCLRVLAGNVASQDGKFILTLGIFDIKYPWNVTGLDKIEVC
jgi:hypothetical protein